MMKLKNETHIEGLLYEHKLEKRVSGEQSKNPGTEYIRGKIRIATDDDCLNIVDVDFTYSTAFTSKGNANATYTVLNNIVEGNLKTVMGDGKDAAAMLRVDSSVGLNDFYSDRSGEVELVSAKINDGGFIHTTNALNEDENQRNKFKADMLIQNVSIREANEERNLPEKAIIKGYVFNGFRKTCYPVEFSATNPKAIDYFTGLDASIKSPVFMTVWGRQIAQTVVREIRQESAFGDDEITEVQNTYKDWVITGCSPEAHDWDDEDTMLAKDFEEMLAQRETYLAERRNNFDESKKNKATASTPKREGFNF